VISARAISHQYRPDRFALNQISLDIQAGQWVTLLGRNGSGKSTFAKHLNVLLRLQQGELTVAGLDAGDEANTWQIRRACGMVFQNPENQFVSSVVGEDVAFGLENYQVTPEAIDEQVAAALAAVGLAGFENHSPHLLSGGQKQRVAIAGVLALAPNIIVFDEATSMLDPAGRRDVLTTMRQLHATGTTILAITHHVIEAVSADRVVLLDDGQVIADGPPRDILPRLDLLAAAGIEPPLAVRAYHDLAKHGVQLAECPLTPEELVAALCP
jgi:energy-coupling factor transport system ATP-binding protein